MARRIALVAVPDAQILDITGPLEVFATASAIRDARLVRTVARLAGRARRVTSVCTGAFLLAEAGLLDGRWATPHWAACERRARRYPAVEVDPDPIFAPRPEEIRA